MITSTGRTADGEILLTLGLSDAPTPFTTTRWRCPFCPTTRSSKSRARAHIARCWHNPAARSCKTCRNYEPAYDDTETRYSEDESCAVGIELPGYPNLPIRCPQWAVEPALMHLGDSCGDIS